MAVTPVLTHRPPLPTTTTTTTTNSTTTAAATTSTTTTTTDNNNNTSSSSSPYLCQLCVQVDSFCQNHLHQQQCNSNNTYCKEKPCWQETKHKLFWSPQLTRTDYCDDDVVGDDDDRHCHLKHHKYYEKYRHQPPPSFSTRVKATTKVTKTHHQKQHNCNLLVTNSSTSNSNEHSNFNTNNCSDIKAISNIDKVTVVIFQILVLLSFNTGHTDSAIAYADSNGKEYNI